MKKLNKKQRNKIYKNAFDKITESETRFICIAIQENCGIKEHMLEIIFLELFLFKPEFESFIGGWLNNKTVDDYCVHNIENRNLRELILLFCIEMTND